MQDSNIQRVYRVRKDYNTSKLESEVADGEGSYNEIYQRYRKDWMEWPVERGAPFTDVDNDGVYNPYVDVPGYPGATQTCWFFANGLHPDNLKLLYDQRMWIEMQFTTWAYGENDKLKNTIYRSYKLINKGNETYNNMYVSIWTDIDIGDPVDDLAGCDSVQNLGFAYNSPNKDKIYGSSAPVIGLNIIQGPIVDGLSTDKAIFNRRTLNGKKNLGMTSFVHLYTSTYPFYEYSPIFSYYPFYYFLMMGLLPQYAEPIVNPVTQKTTKYCLSGDPITRTGWLDGVYEPAGERRIALNSGPFTMAPGQSSITPKSLRVFMK